MEPGAVLSGKYRLIALLGRGGMGSVWRAEHLGLRAPVAVKLLGPAIDATPQMLARFHREAQSTANLRSPHVVEILDHGVHEATQTPFIAMELMEGETLAQRLERVGRLSLVETSRVVTHIARALARAHEIEIVHHDLKPGNVFLVRNDDEDVAKVLDFGIAKWKASPTAIDMATATGTMMGTPHYMSPEQISGRETDQRSDLWTLGVIAFECLAGRRSFAGDNVVALGMQICGTAFPRSRPTVCRPSSTPGSLVRWRASPLDDFNQRASSATSFGARAERGRSARRRALAPNRRVRWIHSIRRCRARYRRH